MAEANVVFDAGADLATVSVLFIAANPVVSREHGLRLRMDGYSVVEAATVQAAAALSQDRPPDLVILDLGPARGGLTVMRELKADPRLGSAPHVLLGAFDDLDEIRVGLRLGARDYLIRGETSPSLVARRVRSWLDDPARRAVGRLSPRPAKHGLSAVPPVVATAPSPGPVAGFTGALVGLMVLLLKETIFLVLGRDGKRA